VHGHQGRGRAQRAAILLAIWHDPQTQRAIIGSGGLGEVFMLPFMMVIPAVIVGTIGGAAGSLSRRLRMQP
jgi:hypothetical protein